MNPFIAETCTVARALLDYDVEFLVVGGAAVNFHGHHRLTTDRHGAPVDKVDLDFWFNPTLNNYYPLLRALESLGFDVSRIRRLEIVDPTSRFLKFATDTYTLDLLPKYRGVGTFREARSRAMLADLGDLDVPVIGYDDLVNNKLAVARAKDLADLEGLRSARGEDK